MIADACVCGGFFLEDVQFGANLIVCVFWG